MEKITLRLLKDWAGMKQGAVIYPRRELTPLAIQQLIKQGIVERYEKKEDK